MSLNETINAIMRGNDSTEDKERALIGLGISRGEIERLKTYYHITETPQPRRRPTAQRVRRAQRTAPQPTTETTTETQPAEVLWHDLRLRYSFGVEIECGVSARRFASAARRNNVTYYRERYNHVDNERYFKFVSDGSLRVENSTECVSPVLRGTDGLQRLQNVCTALVQSGAKIDKTCGLHVHIGAKDFTPKHYYNVFYNYKAIERIVDSFMAVSRRENNNIYCKSLNALTPFEVADNMRTYDVCNEIFTRCDRSRYYKVNAHAFGRHQTIEFRQHQGSVEFDKIANWIKFLQLFVAYSEDNVIAEGSITTIDDLPFLTKELKEYYKNRKIQLNNQL